MVFSIIAKNAAQKISGSTISSGATVITVAAPLTAYTVPAGKTEKVHVLIQVRALLVTQNVRFRIAGGLVFQLGASPQEISPPVVNEDLGIFVINGGDTVGILTIDLDPRLLLIDFIALVARFLILLNFLATALRLRFGFALLRLRATNFLVAAL